MKKKKSPVILIIILLLLGITIGYSALSANLQILGTTKLKGNTWNVHLENIANKVSSGATVTTEPTINGDTLSFNVTLDKPGDYYEFTVDVKNAGGIDAKLGEDPVITGFSAEQLELASYSITYDNNAIGSVSAGDLLAGGQTKTIKVRVEFNSDIDEDDLPSTLTTLDDLTLELNYVQD